LNEVERRFELIFEAGPLGLVLVSLDFRALEVNSRLCEMLGYTREELTSMKFPEVTHPEDIDQDVDLARRLFDGEIPSYNIEKRYLKKSGDVLWGRLTATVVRDDDGAPLYGLGMLEDISEQRQAKEQFEAVFEHSTDGVALLVDGKIAKLNSRLAEMAGRDIGDVAGCSPNEFIPEDEREQATERIRAVAAGAPAFPSEYHMVRPDGSVLPVEVMSQLVEFEGSPAILSVLRDRTERVEAEQALRSSEEKFRRLAETASAAIVIFQENRVLYMNPAAEALTGVSLKELEGLDPWKFIHPEDRLGVKQRISQREEGSEVSAPYQCRIVQKSGEERWVESTATLIDFEGKPADLAVALDITDRVYAQEELRRAREELESKVEARPANANLYALTFRELVVLNIVAAGKADKEIAAELSISPLTVQRHVANILSKMGASSRTEAGVRAVREGLIE
jgi:PAS domain S-box-containing protein